jgi:hypothetical protein
LRGVATLTASSTIALPTGAHKATSVLNGCSERGARREERARPELLDQPALKGREKRLQEHQRIFIIVRPRRRHSVRASDRTESWPHAIFISNAGLTENAT